MSFDIKTLDGIIISVEQSLVVPDSKWRLFDKSTVQLPFMTFEWCSAWLAQNADDFGISPLIVTGTDGEGKTLFILPLQKRRTRGLIIVEWLGQQGNSACSGIFNSTFSGEAWFAENFANLMKLVGPVDAINLRNMPATLTGTSSPLASLHLAEAANASFVTALQPDYELLLRQKRSSRSISKIRRRDLRLEESGVLSVQVLEGDAAIDAVVEGLKHKNAQLKQAGVGDVFTEKNENHYKQILTDAPKMLQVFKLQLDGETIATMIGAKSGSVFWLLISALAPDANLQFSPGDYLLRRTIAHCCAAGVRSFDFCLGDQEYKQLWADQRVPHFNYIRAQKLRALPFVTALKSVEAVKRLVKKNVSVRDAFYMLRRYLRGTQTKP